MSRSKHHEESERNPGRVGVAALVAAATLCMGLIIPQSAVAQDAEADVTQSQTQSQDATVADGQQTTADGANDEADPSQADEATATSIDAVQTVVGRQGDAAMALPQTVTVRYSDGSAQEQTVAWSGNGYSTDADLAGLPAGEYDFTGTVEGIDLPAAVHLTVEAVEAAPQQSENDAAEPADDAADNKTGEPQAGEPQSDEPTVASVDNPVVSADDVAFGTYPAGVIPFIAYESVLVAYQDGSTGWETPVWDEITEEQSNTPGSYIIEGSFEGSDVKVRGSITFASVVSMQVDEVTTVVGAAPEMPSVRFYLVGYGEYQYGVDWDEIDPTLYASANDFTVNGTVSNSSIAVTATVHVREYQSVKEASYVGYVNVMPYAWDLPTTVEVTYSDGTTGQMSVEWTYDPDSEEMREAFKQEGFFTIDGVVSGTDIAATLKVTVLSYTFAPVTAQTFVGAYPSLPSDVTARLSDGSVQTAYVYWDDIDASQYASKGTFEVTGTVPNFGDATVTATVTVKGFSSVESVSVDIIAGQNPQWELPNSVNATLDDGSVTTVAVDWGTLNPDDYAQQGTYTVVGHVSQSSVEVTATVHAWAIRSVKSESVYTLPGVAPNLPYSLGVVLANGDSEWVSVQWESVDPSQYAEQSVFTVRGAVDYTDIPAIVTVHVMPVVEVLSTSSYTTVVGLPVYYWSSMVSVQYADGGVDSLPVQWDEVDPLRYETAGSFTVEGTVQGIDLKATATVNVQELVSNEINITTVKGRAPNLDVSFPLTGNMYYNMDSWDWETVDPALYQKEGQFDVKGKLGGKIDVVAHVLVVSVTSVDPLQAVQTMTGVLPELPYNVKVRYSDGAAETLRVTWNSPTFEQVAQPGEFDVTGTVSQTGTSVSVHVVVRDSQKTRAVTVSTLKGVRPNLPYQVTATLWNGTQIEVVADWETPEPEMYNTLNANGFQVNGYIHGSDVPIVATVKVFDAAPSGAESSVTTLMNVAPTLPSSMGITLTNGDVASVNSGLLWPTVDPEQYAQAGTFDVSGELLGTDVVPVMHVTVTEVVDIDTYYSWTRRYVRGSSYKDLYLPETIGGYAADGTYVSNIPLQWEGIDDSVFDTLGTHTIKGTYPGGSIELTLDVVDITSVTNVSELRTLAGVTSPSWYSTADVTYSDGVTQDGGVDWDELADSAYAQSGEYELTGVVSGTNHRVGGKLTVYDDATAEPTEVWTRPGVVPSLPSQVQVTYSESLLSALADGVAGLFSSRATTGDISDGGTWLPVTWDAIDPADYGEDRENTTFTVNGVITGSDVPVTATVSVESIKSVQLADVATAPGVYPGLPYSVTVVTSAGKSRTMYAQWEAIPVSAYQDAGAVFTVNGSIVDYSSSTPVKVMGISLTVRVKAPAEVKTQAIDGAVTKTGVRPTLASYAPVMLDDGSVVSVPVVWDPIPVEQYQQAGTFTVYGTLNLNAPSAEASEASLAAVARIARASGFVNRVSTQVEVRDDASSGDVSVIDVSVASVAAGVASLPEMVAVHYVGGTATPVPVTWDTSTVDFGKPGTYEVVGKVEGTDKPAYCYVNVKESTADLLEGYDEVSLAVKVGSTARQVADLLPQQVKANYSDGTSKLVGVTWNLTPLTDDALGQKDNVLTITGTVDGMPKTAKATITVTDDATPVSAAVTAQVTTPEGTKPDLSQVKATITWSDGGTTESSVVWEEFGDDLWAEGKRGTSFEVKGITTPDYSLPVTVRVNVTKVAKKYVVTFDANGGVFSDGESTAATTVVEETAVAAPSAAPTREGYKFAGWATEQGGEYDFSTVVTGDLTLVAKWTDVSAPEFAIEGNKDITLVVGDKFDPLAGVTASDNEDGDVTDRIAVDPETVDTSKDGVITLTYTVSDKAGNTAELTRKVTVKANTAALKAAVEAAAKLNADPYTNESWQRFADELAKAKAVLDDTDASQAQVEAAVKALAVAQKALVKDEAVPKITFAETYPPIVEFGDEFDPMAGVTATDDNSGDLTDAIEVTGEVNTGKLGEYTLTYTVTDRAGNTTQVKRTVTVVDTVSPVFVSLSDATIDCWSDFDPLEGVTATDNVDGDVTDSITVEGKVDSAKPGVYTLTYRVSDKTGNTVEVVRTVTVRSQRTTLAILISQGDALAESQSRYTAESWAAFAEALAAAKAVSADPDATDEELKEAYEALNVAVDALKPVKPVDPEPGEPGGSDGPDGGQSPSGGRNPGQNVGDKTDDGGAKRLSATGAAAALPVLIMGLLVAAGAFLMTVRRSRR
ncbi:Bacterial Ig-like domain (group 4) [Bifidobacterium lemurum]|uniref:Bacterial Ig-like domain (Group 4) n=1 Tax=Bifidobacterium lemurum TaxID=1603886 RepID=A0A261FP43_9BIFI|nr:Ig-like domain-containing protein [Bifidobacterium lemurum]OZG60743.1 Bacterial Ig-like domain (group 4) [Bifidobacterium lemurum]QOL35206.1 Ig-like domain-containing protein [Bifidobacterium lemurum]